MRNTKILHIAEGFGGGVAAFFRHVLPGQFPELLTGETVGPKLAIGANGVLILKA